MQRSLEIFVTFEEPPEGFLSNTSYQVISMHDRDFMLIDEHGRFRWIPAERCLPQTVATKEATLFERTWFETNRSYRELVHKTVKVTSLEEMGAPGEARDESGRFVFVGRLESFEQNLLTIVGEGDPPVVATITHRQIASIEEV